MDGRRLLGWAKVEHSTTPHRKEAFELLSTNAGLALDNAGRYEEQRLTVERLEESERLKSDFLTSVSHELRTPLTSILGNSVTLERTWRELDDGTREDLLASLTNRARGHDEKIMALIDVSGSDSASRRSRAVDLSTLLTATVEQLRDRLRAHRLDVQVRPDLVTLGDPVLLSQVVRNLLDNGATHTPPGTRVTLIAQLDEPVGDPRRGAGRGPGELGRRPSLSRGEVLQGWGSRCVPEGAGPRFGARELGPGAAWERARGRERGRPRIEVRVPRVGAPGHRPARRPQR